MDVQMCERGIHRHHPRVTIQCDNRNGQAPEHALKGAQSIIISGCLRAANHTSLHFHSAYPLSIWF